MDLQWKPANAGCETYLALLLTCIIPESYMVLDPGTKHAPCFVPSSWIGLVTHFDQ